MLRRKESGAGRGHKPPVFMVYTFLEPVFGPHSSAVP